MDPYHRMDISATFNQGKRNGIGSMTASESAFTTFTMETLTILHFFANEGSLDEGTFKSLQSRLASSLLLPSLTWNFKFFMKALKTLSLLYFGNIRAGSLQALLSLFFSQMCWLFLLQLWLARVNVMRDAYNTYLNSGASEAVYDERIRK